MADPKAPSPSLLSLKEAAAYLRMSVSWAYKNLKKICPVSRYSGRLKFRKEDIDRLIEQCKEFHLETHLNKSIVAIEVKNGKTIPRK